MCIGTGATSMHPAAREADDQRPNSGVGTRRGVDFRPAPAIKWRSSRSAPDDASSSDLRRVALAPRAGAAPAAARRGPAVDARASRRRGTLAAVVSVALPRLLGERRRRASAPPWVGVRRSGALHRAAPPPEAAPLGGGANGGGAAQVVGCGRDEGEASRSTVAHDPDRRLAADQLGDHQALEVVDVGDRSGRRARRSGPRRAGRRGRPGCPATTSTTSTPPSRPSCGSRRAAAAAAGRRRCRGRRAARGRRASARR